LKVFRRGDTERDGNDGREKSDGSQPILVS
jgi:hypothetical protein